MFCTSCSTHNDPGNAVCQRCGWPLSLLPDSGARSRGDSISRLLLLVLPVIAVLSVGVFFLWQEHEEEAVAAMAYDRGLGALAVSDYDTAQREFMRADDYADAPAQLAQVRALVEPWQVAYLDGLAALEAERYEAAIEIFARLQSDAPEFRDSAFQLQVAQDGYRESLLREAEVAVFQHDWIAADTALSTLAMLDPDNLEVSTRLVELRRAHAPLLFCLGRELFVIGPDLEDQRLITDAVSAAAPVWSPDRNKIAFLSPNGDGSLTGSVYVIDSDGSNLTQIRDDALMVPYPAWSPDGQTLALIVPTPHDLERSRIALITLASGETTYIDPEGRGASSVTWSPDGKQVAFVAEDLIISESLGVISRAGEVKIATLADGALTNLTNGSVRGATTVQWSPTGDYLAIWETLSGTGWYDAYQSTIYLLDLASGETQPLTYSTEIVGPPSWSPSGDRLAWVRGGNVIQVRWLPGTRSASISASQSISDRLVWSPDGFALLAASTEGEGSSIIVPLPDGPKPSQSFQLQFDMSWPNFGPQWAPLTQPARPLEVIPE